ncbi:restriction endonuclease subunit S [Desulfobacter postgatei]|uniref:restriction endonuclease subunit S n=1 Tax=Desulfobacter postgatei TaxID=2293 RepID=UPI000232C4B3|nr:restriction endonuclease subunit S [Desulfobacter postgatei]
MSSTVKLKYKIDPIRRGNPPSCVENGGIPVVNQACVWPSGLDSSKFKHHNPEEIRRIDAWLKEGDVLVNSTETGTLGRVCHLNFEPETDIFADGHVTILRATKKVIKTRYLFYVLYCQQERITVECSEGATNQIELSRFLLGNFKLEWPPLATQTQIANYLDRKTAELDQLIGAKQRLLKLLDEKKTRPHPWSEPRRPSQRIRYSLAW